MRHRPPTPEPAPRAPRRGPGLVLALALHALVLLGLRETLRQRPAPVAAEPPALLWLRVAPPRPAAPAPHTPPRAASRAAPPAVRPPPAATTALAWAAPARPAERPAEPAEPPASAASAAPPGRLLDTAASRTALRRMAGQPLLHERTAGATGLPVVRPDAALATGVAGAALPDCLKDPVPGGLLGLPLLALRAAQGRCAR